MATQRRRNLIASRRRVDDEGEDEETLGDFGDDSHSEASALTDAGENVDGDDSDLTDGGINRAQQSTHSEKSPNGKRRDGGKRKQRVKQSESARGSSQSHATSGPQFKTTAETEAMMNGLRSSDGNDEEHETIDFDQTAEPPLSAESATLPPTSAAPSSSSKRETLRERRIREHEEYKSKRDSDPAFVPNRGGFFMHDQRNGTNGFPGFGRGRGRGRGAPFDDPRPSAQPREPTKDRWDHDLHESIANAKPEPPRQPQEPRPEQQVQPTGSAAASLSKTISIGTLSLRAFLPGMDKPRVFERIPVRQHTRLPDLRPPLRRDKAVRISLPEHAPQYIFPSTERSFIFIPRAQRPNQGSRQRGRGYLSQSASRRTSVHGGSYASSIAMSRKSSQARDGFVSPVGSLMSRPPPAIPAPARPVVKLPAVGPTFPVQIGSHAVIAPDGTPLPNMAALQHSLVASAQPFQHSRPNQIPMHQPRPQKTVSVASIESPSSQMQASQQQPEDHTFHQQIGPQMNGQASSAMMSHSRQASYQGQPTLGTPLSNIPEGAINAQPFQPGILPQQQFYPPYPMYYYPAPQQDQFGGPMFVQSDPYFMPMVYGGPATQLESSSGSGPAGPFAHESNGMVYYYPQPHLMNNGDDIQPGNYPVEGTVPMMQGGAEGFFYQQPPQPAVYYPPQ